MSDNKDNLPENYSNVEEVRQLIDTKIEHLKQLLDERKAQLNHELDKVEFEVISSDEMNRSMIQKLADYENATISLFGESDSSPHLATIKSKVSSLERELTRKKVYFIWKDNVIAANMGLLGKVAFESNNIYENVDKLLKDELTYQSKFATKEKESKFPQNIPQEGESVHEIYKEKYIRVITPPPKGNQPPPIRKKPTIRRASTTDDSKNIPQSPNKSISDVLKGSEHKRVFSEQATSPDELSEITYESFEETTVTTPVKEEAPVTAISATGKGNLFETANEQATCISEVSDITYESMEEAPVKESTHKETDRKKWKLKGEKVEFPSKPKQLGPHSTNAEPDQEYEVIEESRLIDTVQLAETPLLKVPRSITSEKSIKSLTIGRKSKKWIYDLPVISVCKQGPGIGFLSKPKGVCISDKGKIFVAEKGNNRVQVFTKDGNHLYTFGEKSGQNKMVEPNGIWTSSHYVYVTLTNLNTIQMYTIQGGFVKQKAKEGKEEGRFKLPCGISGDTLRERLYICDTGNNRIQILDKNLHFIKVMRTTVLDKPLDIKVMNSGNLVVVLDRSTICIHVFKGSGELIKEIIETQSIPKLINPLYLTVSNGNILLSDYSSNCIHTFSDEGELIWSLGESGRGKPFEEPRGLACDIDGRLVTVCNRKEEQLQIFEI